MAGNNTNIELVIMGGSAGSLPVLLKIIGSLPVSFKLPIIIVIHRQRNVFSELVKILNNSSPLKKIVEPDDKEAIGDCCIYLAPQNYHLLIEKDRTFSLDYSEAVLFSRPSIDVTFESAARVYEERLVAILLTGANADGTVGLSTVVGHGGIAVAQDPSTAEYPAMPLSAVKNVKDVVVLSPEKILTFLTGLMSNGK